MRKYQQLLIISLGLLSFICFLIYKHEYDRLRNVLQVLEVFGSPPAVVHPETVVVGVGEGTPVSHVPSANLQPPPPNILANDNAIIP